MKRFNFSLEAVRLLRQRQERQAMEVYARKLQAQVEELAALEAARQHQADYLNEWQNRISTGCPAGEVVRRHSFSLKLQAACSELENRAALARSHAEQAFSQMLLARKQSAAVEKLFDRQRAAHYRDQERLEQKFLDELAGRRSEPVVTSAILQANAA